MTTSEQLYDIESHAKMAFKSNMYPRELQQFRRYWDESGARGTIQLLDEESTIAAIAMTIATGVEVGMPPVRALHNIVWIRNKPCVLTQMALAMAQASERWGYMDETIRREGGEIYAECNLQDHEDNGLSQGRFDTVQARDAGLMRLDHWKDYTVRMLQIRARGWALRDGFAHVLNGLSLIEEQRDYATLKGSNDDKLTVTEDDDEFTQAELTERYAKVSEAVEEVDAMTKKDADQTETEVAQVAS